VTLPLLFVQNRTQGLLGVALAVFAAHVPLAWLGQTVAGLAGLSLALAVTTLGTLALMLRRLHAVGPTLVALGLAAATVAVVACVAFLVPAIVVRPGLAAAVGLAVYAAALLAIRPAGLVGSWRYLRALV
jgi:hypothetical protein